MRGGRGRGRDTCIHVLLSPCLVAQWQSTRLENQWQSTCLESRVSWVRIPPEAAHFSLEKRVVSGVVTCYCIALLCCIHVYIGQMGGLGRGKRGGSRDQQESRIERVSPTCKISLSYSEVSSSGEMAFDENLTVFISMTMIPSEGMLPMVIECSWSGCI